ncbi:anhydro-N-acetylmuramic acid kinase [Agromyces sp. NPDC058126]|uniref:anhydro-N-acetylmuramic acid kinase n=1 Tax=Agromyces sp. NPDC058126 TaxID=3346350 RepID=UPI0036DC992B
MIVLSLQSGTSADGIDVAVVEIEPARAPERASDATPLRLTPLHTSTVDWDPALRARILSVAAGEALDAGGWNRLTTELGQAFAEAAAGGIRASGATPELIVSHGQTVHHWVEDGHARGTLQLGEPAWIAERAGVPVLSDVRMADIAAGGEGAPLMAFFDRLWLGGEARGVGRTIATVNLGGIANVQLVGADGSVVAFDTGPGNCLIDAVVDRHSAGAQGYDEGGRLAAAGRVHEGLLAALLAHPYFAARAPKSTGRETFDLGVVDAALAAMAATAGGETGADPRGVLPVADLVATLTELTARTVVDALVDDAPVVLVCSGGGALNPVLLARIAQHATARGISVESSAARGLDPAFKESLMFALLGYCSRHGVPIELRPDPAGARVLGRFSPGPQPLDLPAPLAGVASIAIEHRTIEHRTDEHRTNGGATP